MEKKELRKADFITSVLLLLFSIWMLIETFKMPMKDTFGGVQNVWYVSPALFPLIISIFISVLGIALFIHSIKSGGAKYFLDSIFMARLRCPYKIIIRYIQYFPEVNKLIYD